MPGATTTESASATQTLLDTLRSRSAVDVDSLNSSFAEKHGPFVDATSNQAIAFIELSEARNQSLIDRACQIAKQEGSSWPEITTAALATEVAQILLALNMLPSLTGRFHIQANPFDAYSIDRTVRCGQRLSALVSKLHSPEAATRLCLKVPATYEGLMACRILENEKDIRTLATTLFTIEQALLAAEAGCTYIAPYVNELPVHFITGHIDPAPNNSLVVEIQGYYEAHSIATRVLPASLISAAECMGLAGAHHITIAPVLLAELASAPALTTANLDAKYPSLFDMPPTLSATITQQKPNFSHDEAEYRMAVTRKDAGKQEKKLVDAINIFADMQEKLELMMMRGLA